MGEVITISGKARHGKNTLADLLKAEFEYYGYKVAMLAYADYVKLLARNLYGWDGNKDEKGRTLLQELGTDVVRSINPNFWVNIVEQTINVFQKKFDFFIITDARFKNEIEYLDSKGYKTLSIYIERPNFQTELNSKQQQHPSETGISKNDCDLYILNTSLDTLKIKAENIVANIIT